MMPQKLLLENSLGGGWGWESAAAPGCGSDKNQKLCLFGCLKSEIFPQNWKYSRSLYVGNHPLWFLAWPGHGFSWFFGKSGRHPLLFLWHKNFFATRAGESMSQFSLSLWDSQSPLCSKNLRENRKGNLCSRWPKTVLDPSSSLFTKVGIFYFFWRGKQCLWNLLSA